VKDSAGDVWEAFQAEGDQPLYQCQIKHDVARSVTYQFRDKMAEFLRVTEGVPDDLNQLAENGIRLITADKNDPEDIGIVPWRVCFYVVKSVNNWLLMMDMFWKYLSDQMAKETRP